MQNINAMIQLLERDQTIRPTAPPEESHYIPIPSSVQPQQPQSMDPKAKKLAQTIIGMLIILMLFLIMYFLVLKN